MNERGDEFRTRIQEHVEQYRRSDGAEGGRMAMGPGTGSEVLLLTTTGRKSGRAATTPLVFFHEGEWFVVVASNGGLASHPAWYFNLSSNPSVRLKVFADEFDANARTATAAERRRIWPKITAASPGYQKYQDGVSREIPLVMIRRAE